MTSSLNQDPTPALEVVDLVRRYGNILAVDRLSLKIMKGEVFGFLGPNGAGKTTSIRMMCGLLKPDSGEVHINGSKVGPGDHAIRSKVGICPQHIVLWNKLTCFEQLVFMARMYDVPGALARARADSLLDRIGLKEKRNKLASTLSGGMKRRMNVILALVHDPAMVVFDEPEAGLDPQSRIMVREFIQQTAEDKTVIFTTHNMDEADRISDRIAIIDHGRLLQLDTPANLKRSIGEGDILELSLSLPGGQAKVQAEKQLKASGLDLIGTGEQCLIKSMDLVPKIPEIYRIFKSCNIQVQGMHLRENTLEDVFIQLTGRSLR